jgi:hypothetical protein
MPLPKRPYIALETQHHTFVQCVIARFTQEDINVSSLVGCDLRTESGHSDMLIISGTNDIPLTLWVQTNTGLHDRKKEGDVTLSLQAGGLRHFEQTVNIYRPQDLHADVLLELLEDYATSNVPF